MSLFGKRSIATVNVTTNEKSVATSNNRTSKTGEAKSNMFKLAANMADLHTKLEAVIASDMEPAAMLEGYFLLQEECLAQFDSVSEEHDALVKKLGLSSKDLTSELYNLNLNQIDKVKLLVLSDRLDVINEFCSEIEQVIELHQDLMGDME